MRSTPQPRRCARSCSSQGSIPFSKSVSRVRRGRSGTSEAPMAITAPMMPRSYDILAASRRPPTVRARGGATGVKTAVDAARGRSGAPRSEIRKATGGRGESSTGRQVGTVHNRRALMPVHPRCGRRTSTRRRPSRWARTPPGPRRWPSARGRADLIPFERGAQFRDAHQRVGASPKRPFAPEERVVLVSLPPKPQQDGTVLISRSAPASGPPSRQG